MTRQVKIVTDDKGRPAVYFDGVAVSGVTSVVIDELLPQEWPTATIKIVRVQLDIDVKEPPAAPTRSYPVIKSIRGWSRVG